MRLRGPVIAGAALALAVAALRVRDPHQAGSWGHCPTALFGVWCPGCGGLRAVNDLTHGDVAAAASSNLLLVASIPLVAWLVVRWVHARWQGRHRPLAPGAARALGVGYAVLAVAFTVARNLPGSWLAP